MGKTQALGTVLKQGTTVIGNVTSLTTPNPTKPEIDVTDFASTAMEFLPGIPDNGEMSIGGFGNYADAGQTILRADAHDPLAVAKAFTIEFTKQAFKAVFNAYVKTYTFTAPDPQGAYTFDATLRVTGTVVFSAL